MAKDRVVDRCDIARVGPSLLTLDKVNLFVGQVSVKFVNTDWLRE